MSEKKYISIKGAKENNLKNINLDIPKNTITVLTGLSGSGKSSLAFNTIYAEGQRRYVESLSAYARQFLDTFDKPDVESIEGLSPAISIEQKTTSKNPRSTVGTITEIYDYLRLLYARIGIPYSPTTGLPIEKQSITNMVDKVLSLENDTKIYILSPIVRGRKGEFKKDFLELRKKGFQRVKIDDQLYEIEDIPPLDKNIKHNISVVIDRLIVKPDISQRLHQSIETAVRISDGLCIVENLLDNTQQIFSEKFACAESGFSIEEIEPRLFSFNNPFGACPVCNGLGIQSKFSEELIIPDKTKPFIDAIAPWNTQGTGFYYKALLESLAKKYDINLKTPFFRLSDGFKKILLYGSSENIEVLINTENRSHTVNKPFEGVIPNLERRYKSTESTSSRDYLNVYMVEQVCLSCKGKRLNSKALQVKIDMLNIYDICEMSIENCLVWVKSLDKKLSTNQKLIGEKLLKEIGDRLFFLNNVGIGYLNLSRSAGTLSGGESQRIRLASQIGSGLTGVLYVLDEPSIGLHQKDNDKLIETLKHLKNLDNTVIVVEHDEDTMLESDFLVDIGPKAGILGGEVVAYGTPQEVMDNPNSITGKYLKGELKIAIPKQRRSFQADHVITIKGAKGNNLKNITVDIPLGVMTCVTGVSGSGKSTLINETLYKVASQHIYNSKADPAEYDNIYGLEEIDKVIDIDQSPIGRMPSSNPATYTKVFDLIREIFAELPEAKARGYKNGRFSFNVKGGRCENCSGDGIIKIEMHFLPDVYIQCEECKGARYNKDTLEIKWKDKSIADVLNMTVLEACNFFNGMANIYNKLKSLNDVGLGYIKLGQSATTFSGGEAQRIKLAKELSKKSTGKTLYILDEPTTGLHFEDVNNLLKVLQTLVDKGNTIVIIEHNLDVIKVADYIIDVGPEGGNGGGTIIAKGTPEDVAKVKQSYTGIYLAKALKKQ